MAVFTVTYDRRISSQGPFHRTVLKTHIERFKSFQDAVIRARAIKASGVSANTPLIEERR